MTRATVYGTSLVTFAAATAMTVTAILLPRWVSYSVPPGYDNSGSDSGSGHPFWQTLGLHSLCASEADPRCRPFPLSDRDCLPGPDQRYFCSVWRSAGFVMTLAVAVELAALVGYIVILAGGRQKRESGWRVLASLLAGVVLLHVFALSTVAYLRDFDDRFLVPGWRLDISWALCTASAGVAALSGGGLVLSALILPPEDGYEFLNDPIL